MKKADTEWTCGERSRTSRSGFTMVEILVVIAILGIMGVVVTDIFIRNLRGNEKARVIASIKQNGQAVLERIDKKVRAADNVACVTAGGETMVIVKNGEYTRYRFQTEGGVQTIVEDNPTFSGTPTLQTFLADICTLNDYPGATKLALTDTSPQTGVWVEYTQPFSRNKLSGFKDTVTVTFKLKPSQGTSLTLASQVDPVEFQTTIALR